MAIPGLPTLFRLSNEWAYACQWILWLTGWFAVRPGHRHASREGLQGHPDLCDPPRLHREGFHAAKRRGSRAAPRATLWLCTRRRVGRQRHGPALFTIRRWLS